MDDTGLSSDAAVVLARLHACLDELLALPLDPVTDDELVDVWRSVETVTRRFAAVDHRLIGQVQSRSLPFHYGAASPSALMRQVLRVSSYEARSRVAGAEAAMPRVGVSGEPLPAHYPAVAQGQAEGAISAAHARIVTSTIDRLPYPVQAEHGVWAEELLVDTARQAAPETVGKAAAYLSSSLDPDGKYADPAHRERCRKLRFTVRPDGSAHGSFDFTAEATEALRTLLDVYAAPKPAVDGVKDIRTVGQRQHDGILDAFHAALRAEQVPDAAGVTTTIILTATVEDWETGTGTTTTGHGVVIPTRHAKQWVSGDSRVIAVAFTRLRRIQAYSTCQRLFSENQRLAMTARDLGCTFPDCDSPPQRCEANHVQSHAEHGPTTTDNGALLCRFHHREHEKMGWIGTIINGVPHYIPPRWIDPERTPRRNTIHHPDLHLVPT